jgi:hypothetical protein
MKRAEGEAFARGSDDRSPRPFKRTEPSGDGGSSAGAAVQEASSHVPSNEAGVLICTVNRLDGDSFGINIRPTGRVAEIRHELSKLLPELDPRDMLLYVDGQEEPVVNFLGLSDLLESSGASPAHLELFMLEGAPARPQSRITPTGLNVRALFAGTPLALEGLKQPGSVRARLQQNIDSEECGGYTRYTISTRDH